jgi:thiamine-monophosphate kinase
VGERERIVLLERVLNGGDASVLLGIGDDAAVFKAKALVVSSIDAVVEHVHFERAWLSLSDLGFKATMAALSDLAAMGARPRGVLSSLVLPKDIGDDELEAIATGQREACDLCRTTVMGGNMARGDALSITTTVIGETPRPMLRSGARPGDRLLLAGHVGQAALGLKALMAGDSKPAAAIEAWRRPLARIEQGLLAASVAHAAIDISDGLALDSWRMAEASAVKLVLDRDLESALHGGEDYALLVAAAVPIEGFREVGLCEEGEGVLLAGEPEAERTAVDRRGWDHFAPE